MSASNTGLRASSKRPPLVVELTPEDIELAKSQARQKLRQVMVSIIKADSLNLPEKDYRPIMDRLYSEKRVLHCLLNSYNSKK